MTTNSKLCLLIDIFHLTVAAAATVTIRHAGQRLGFEITDVTEEKMALAFQVSF